MTERPILFSSPMVRALMSGTKTQTRRALKVQPIDVSPMKGANLGREWVGLMQREPEPKGVVFACKFGVPGDQLRVRETAWERPQRTEKMMREGADTWPPYFYDADGISEAEHEQLKAWGWKRRPSIHLPRLGSRITLEIVAVRVEKLQDISEEDALAEGVIALEGQFDGCYMAGTAMSGTTAKECYARLWDQINGAGAWASNPWVWAIEFKRVIP